MREPSARRSCSDVAGWDSSTPAHSVVLLAGAAAAAAAEVLVPPPKVCPVPWNAVCLCGAGSATQCLRMEHVQSYGPRSTRRTCVCM